MTLPAHLLAVDIGGTNLRIALTTSSGEVLGRRSVATTHGRDASAVVRAIADGAAELLRDARLAPGALAAVGAGAPGPTDAKAGVVLVTSYLMGWRDVPLKAMLEDALGIPAAVDNDVNLAALGESHFGAGRDHPDFVFIAIGTGVGAGILLGGKLFQGSAWMAGEIGYMLVPGVSEEPPGSGEPGALEAMLGGEGLRTAWRAQWSREATTHPQDMTATAIFDAALAGDVLANRQLDRAARALAYVVCDISLILNAPLFVLGGSVGLHSALRQRAQLVVDAHARGRAPRIVPSTLGSEAQLMGAVRLAQFAASLA